MAKIVVTGGSGMLGTEVIRELLAHGFDVLSVDRAAPKQDVCASAIVDLTREDEVTEALRGADGAVHLGAYQAPGIVSDPQTFSNNTTASYNVLHAAAANGARRVVLASSTAAFGFLYARKPFAPDYLPLDENHPCRPQDPYGLSKVVAEATADAFVRVYDLAVVSLRFPGVNFEPDFHGFAERFQDPGVKLGRVWSYIDARDAAAACRLGLETPRRGHTVLVAAAPTSTVAEPTDELLRRYFPGVKKARVALGGNWSGVDSTRAREVLGFQARHVWEKYLR
ncbi:MAG TPA: NAD(P)-dependent oxidoreductase [Candidatus Binatia bacterium]|nr:NAD(P)-dependent oxidoreductase [Candidatus Binatia bacterium]